VRRALSDVIRELPVVAAASGTSVRHAAADGCEVRELRSLPESVTALMGKTAAVWRERMAAHQARELKLEEIGFLAGQKDGEIRSLKAVLDKRESDLSAKEKEIGEKEAEIDSKEAEIHAKETEIDSKEAEINSKESEIHSKEAEIQSKELEIHSKETEIHSKEAEIHAKEAEIDSKEAEIGRKQAEIDSLARVCEERLQLIVRLDKNLKACAAEIERLRAEVAAAKRT
jgi:chromosome segregation ATPase